MKPISEVGGFDTLERCDVLANCDGQLPTIVRLLRTAAKETSSVT